MATDASPTTSDVVIRLDSETVARAFAALDSVDYHPAVPVSAEQFGNAETRERLRLEKHMIVLKFWSDRHQHSPLDIFVTEPFDFEAEYTAAFIQQVDTDIPVRFLQFDSLLAMKRSAGRQRDLADVEELEFIRDGSYENRR